MSKIFKSLENLAPKEQPSIAPKFTNIDLNMSEVYNQITRVDNTSEQDLITMIKNSYHVFLDDAFLHCEKNRDEIINVFGNLDFLHCLIRVMETEQINNSERICCNKIAWDYISHNKDLSKELKETLLQLSYTVNRGIVNILSTKIPLNVAKFVCLARYSSFNETKNIKRMNRVLIKSNMNSEQDIINTYSVLNRDNVTQLFETIMFDVDDSLKDNEVYGSISLAVLDILENMMTSDIRKVLNSYAETYNLLDKKRVRFTIYSIAVSDYPRILSMVEMLKKDEIYVP